MKQTILIAILIIMMPLFIGAMIHESLKSPADRAKEEEIKQDESYKIEQDYQHDMAAKYRELEHKAWSGTKDDLREFQNWKDQHVKVDGSFE
jgi:hypothetical protein